MLIAHEYIVDTLNCTSFVRIMVITYNNTRKFDNIEFKKLLTCYGVLLLFKKLFVFLRYTY